MISLSLCVDLLAIFSMQCAIDSFVCNKINASMSSVNNNGQASIMEETSFAASSGKYKVSRFCSLEHLPRDSDGILHQCMPAARREVLGLPICFVFLEDGLAFCLSASSTCSIARLFVR